MFTERQKELTVELNSVEKTITILTTFDRDDFHGLLYSFSEDGKQ